GRAPDDHDHRAEEEALSFFPKKSPREGRDRGKEFPSGGKQVVPGNKTRRAFRRYLASSKNMESQQCPR
ncbi:MAG TPA: hypothetical protein PK834_14545, partial [Thauera aminoaromatica]|nr:hypothetical protein [Thauera aminoaromatica]